MIEIKDIDWSNQPKTVRKAAEYYLKKNKFETYSDGAKLEPHFLEKNGFVCGEKYECDGYGKDFIRNFMFSEGMAEYYCTPYYQKPIFKIRKCAEIQKAELLDTEAGDGSLTGALLFGAAGAVAGSANKKAVLLVRLHTSNVDEPIVDVNILVTPLSRGDLNYAGYFEKANKIYGQLKAIAEKNNPQAGNGQREANNTDDVVGKIRKFKELLDEGILTQEEFEAKKKQLLGI